MRCDVRYAKTNYFKLIRQAENSVATMDRDLLPYSRHLKGLQLI